MRLATIRTGDVTTAVRIDGDEAVELGSLDVGALLTDPGWRTRPGTGPRHRVAGLAADDLVLETIVDDQLVQRVSTADLVFPPAELISYVSTVVTLEPGDVIATGTPGGVGHARKPPRYLGDGTRLTTRISGLGECRDTCRAEKPDGS